MERNEPFLVNEIFHVYNRGVDKRPIFIDEHDYNRFLILLYLCNSLNPTNLQKVFNSSKGRSFTGIFEIDRGQELVHIGSWVLMPNHFHLLIKSNVDDGISIFLKKVCTGYSMYFNQKYNRSGTLFQGRFKSTFVSDDLYLKYLFHYIHLNPIKLIRGEENWREDGIKNFVKVKEFLNRYKYSSFTDYNRDTIFGNIINKVAFEGYEDSIENIIKTVYDYIH
jgi:putative transposase